MAIKEVKISLDLDRVFIDESKRKKMFKIKISKLVKNFTPTQ
jgi:hypothetical protein